MKLSWRDVVTSALAIFGGAIVYAKLYDYSWWLVGDNWRNAIAVIGLTGLAMALVSGFDFLNRSILNMTEMLLGIAAVVIAIAGIIAPSALLFYVLAGTIGLTWLLEVARHTWHSLGEESDTTYTRQAPVH